MRTSLALSLVAGLSVPLVAAAPASAEELRDLCVDRPGKDTPPCIVDVGHVLVEVGAAEFSRDVTPEEKTSSYGLADTLVRIGVTDRSEVQIGFAPYNIVHSRDRLTGERSTIRGVGDLTGAFKLNFANPDGQGTSAAAQLFVSAPVGREGIGSDGWEGGLIVPVSFELPAGLSLTIDPEVDWRADEDGHGHHRALTGVVSLAHELADGLEGSVELWASRDRDPVDHRTEASADLSLAWQPPSTTNLQFDAEVDLGLTSEAAVGVAYRF